MFATRHQSSAVHVPRLGLIGIPYQGVLSWFRDVRCPTLLTFFLFNSTVDTSQSIWVYCRSVRRIMPVLISPNHMSWPPLLDTRRAPVNLSMGSFSIRKRSTKNVQSIDTTIITRYCLAFDLFVVIMSFTSSVRLPNVSYHALLKMCVTWCSLPLASCSEDSEVQLEHSSHSTSLSRHRHSLRAVSIVALSWTDMTNDSLIDDTIFSVCSAW